MHLLAHAGTGRRPGRSIADLSGSTLAAAALKALRRADRSRPSPPPMLDLDALLDANISFHGVLIQDDGQRTRALTALLDNGTLRPAVSHLHPLEAAARHTGSWGAGTPRSKIVLDVAGS